MFEKIQKAVEDYYDDDARHFLDRHGGKLYFLQSDHHNAELFVIVCDDKPEILAAIEKANQEQEQQNQTWPEPITSTVEKILLENGGIKLGDDDDLRDKRRQAEFEKHACELIAQGHTVTKRTDVKPYCYKFLDFYTVVEKGK